MEKSIDLKLYELNLFRIEVFIMSFSDQSRT